MNELLKKITKYNIIIGIVYVLASIPFFSYPRTLGVALGSALMTTNFYVMIYIIQKAFSKGKIEPLPIIFYVFKVLVLFTIAFFVIYFKLVDYLFFIAGTTSILFSLLLAAMFYKREKIKENS